MPKGKRNAKKGGASGGSGGFLPGPKCRPDGSDPDSASDNASIISGFSDGRSLQDESVLGEEVDEQTQIEIFEEKLKEAIDGATQKSAAGRTNSLQSVCSAFLKKYLPDFVTDRKMTLTDIIERSLKKGKTTEQMAAARLAVLLCCQLPDPADTESVFKDLQPTLLIQCLDKTASPAARISCCTCLSLCSFLAGGELNCIISLMKNFESIFKASYLKGNRSVPSHSPEISALHNAALLSWSLLLTLHAPSSVYDMVESQLSRLPEVLESPDVELRITAGEVVALCYEMLRRVDDNFEADEEDVLCAKLKELATDSHKYRAKKDRKQQRSSFRDILHTVEDKDYPDIQIKFGQEVLEIDSWASKRQYDSFCAVLGSGMNLHLTENDLIREMFDLGPPILNSKALAAKNKISKYERHLMNMQACKVRTVARGKFRDKRSTTLD